MHRVPQAGLTKPAVAGQLERGVRHHRVCPPSFVLLDWTLTLKRAGGENLLRLLPLEEQMKVLRLSLVFAAIVLAQPGFGQAYSDAQRNRDEQDRQAAERQRERDRQAHEQVLEDLRRDRERWAKPLQPEAGANASRSQASAQARNLLGVAALALILDSMLSKQRPGYDANARTPPTSQIGSLPPHLRSFRHTRFGNYILRFSLSPIAEARDESAVLTLDIAAPLPRDPKLDQYLALALQRSSGEFLLLRNDGNAEYAGGQLAEDSAYVPDGKKVPLAVVRYKLEDGVQREQRMVFRYW
jgi:hypothetical protein